MNVRVMMRGAVLLGIGALAHVGAPPTALAYSVGGTCTPSWLVCSFQSSMDHECWYACGDDFYALQCGPVGSCPTNGSEREIICIDWDT
jgi:hypothetical protein